jgi:hypothetical protein
VPSPEATGLTIIQRQIAELDALAKQTISDLNTVAGTERVAKWKARTVTLISDTVGHEEGQTFATIRPGLSFTNDLLEEFTDLVDCYRAPLVILAKKLAQAPSARS